ncbi:hypothetical protein CHISP_0241 [Chitinispirillum alkaliphilum]|nr:hypothetical protein CHISP_0241 [Chitinispirillum alkaliphilum]
MKLTPSIKILPILHGKIAFAHHIRELFSNEKFDCVAVDIPAVFQNEIGEAVDKLPIISALVAKGFEDLLYYLPIDPCDAAVEAVRQARQRRIPFHCIGSPELFRPSPLRSLPDEYAMKSLGFDIYSTLCLNAAGLAQSDSNDDIASTHIAHKLHHLRASEKNILALVHFRRYASVIKHFDQEKTYNLRFDTDFTPEIISRIINPDHLYFALGELPFIAGKSEMERLDLFSNPIDSTEVIKDLFRETRTDYMEEDSIVQLSPVRIQSALTFLRNLTVTDGRFTPSLPDIVEAAKGVGGNSYGLKILQSARYYPFLPFEKEGMVMNAGIDKVSLSISGNHQERQTFEAINLFRDIDLQWKKLSIKPDPALVRNRKYRYTWNPHGMCSHEPEDIRIETFNTHLRKKALRVLNENFCKSEKFTCSVKDGIDIRETLRNWHTGDIYIKEIPPVRGKLDTVVIIFDEDHDERYPHRTVWYAEHDQESTLTFFASDPFEDILGPGIARCTYGGLSLLFPPRSIPSAFELFGRSNKSCAYQLTAGALLFSKEKAVAYVASKRPGLEICNLAAKHNKKLVWLPLSTFSNETLRRLRRFHILNGKEVRSWASGFIGD